MASNPNSPPSPSPPSPTTDPDHDHDHDHDPDHDHDHDPSVPPTRTAPSSGPGRHRARFSLGVGTSFTQLPVPAPRSVGSTRSNSPEPLRTPSLSESYADLRRTLSLHSLRELEARQLQEAVWRKGEKRARAERTERVHRPGNVEECWAHAVRGGLREYAREGGEGGEK